jgi:hypothetical protein
VKRTKDCGGGTEEAGREGNRGTVHTLVCLEYTIYSELVLLWKIYLQEKEREEKERYSSYDERENKLRRKNVRDKHIAAQHSTRSARDASLGQLGSREWEWKGERDTPRKSWVAQRKLYRKYRRE